MIASESISLIWNVNYIYIYKISNYLNPISHKAHILNIITKLSKRLIALAYKPQKWIIPHFKENVKINSSICIPMLIFIHSYNSYLEISRKILHNKENSEL